MSEPRTVHIVVEAEAIRFDGSTAQGSAIQEWLSWGTYDAPTTSTGDRRSRVLYLDGEMFTAQPGDMVVRLPSPVGVASPDVLDRLRPLPDAVLAMAQERCERFVADSSMSCADDPSLSPDAEYEAERYCWTCRLRAALAPVSDPDGRIDG